MEKKVSITLLVGFLITILIYLFLRNENYNLMVMGDSLVSGNTPYNISGFSFSDLLDEDHSITNYNNDYGITNLTSRDLYNLIVENDQIKNTKIKQVISKADDIIIAIGIDELHNNQNINLYLYYMDNILREVTNINNNVLVLSLYSSNPKIEDINKSLFNLTIKYDIDYLDITSINNNQYKYEDSYYLNLFGHDKIKQLIIDENKIKINTSN